MKQFLRVAFVAAVLSVCGAFSAEADVVSCVKVDHKVEWSWTESEDAPGEIKKVEEVTWDCGGGGRITITTTTWYQNGLPTGWAQVEQPQGGGPFIAVVGLPTDPVDPTRPPILRAQELDHECVICGAPE